VKDDRRLRVAAFANPLSIPIDVISAASGGSALSAVALDQQVPQDRSS
jgi:hypothetical protein